MWVSLNMLTTSLETPCRDVPRGKPIHLATSGLHVQYTHAYFVPGFFVSKITTCPGTERATSLSTVWLILQPLSSFRFLHKSKRGLKWLADCPSSPVKAKVECCESHDVFSCQVTDCSATRIPSSSIMGCHP